MPPTHRGIDWPTSSFAPACDGVLWWRYLAGLQSEGAWRLDRTGARRSSRLPGARAPDGAAREEELLAVGREVDLVAAADGERRRVEGAGGEVASRSAERHIKDVAARRFLPCLPVPVEEASDRPRLRRPGPLGSRLVLDA